MGENIDRLWVWGKRVGVAGGGAGAGEGRQQLNNLTPARKVLMGTARAAIPTS